MAAQAAHASMAFITRRLDIFNVTDPGEDDHFEAAFLLTPREVEWLNNSFTKICVGVSSELDLHGIHQDARQAGIESHLVLDNGTTEFGGLPTYTCLALGPDEVERIDKLTGHLKLL